LIIREPAIERWAQETNGGPSNELGAQRAEQFPHLRNYTLTLVCRPLLVMMMMMVVVVVVVVLV